MNEPLGAGDNRHLRALITGASGFAGRHLAGHLIASTNWEITGLQTHAAAPLEGVRMLSCDLLDADLTQRVVAHHRPEIIFHLAAQAYVPKAVANPAGTLNTNIIAQVNLLEACRAVGIDPIIVVVSSADIYGDVPPEQSPIRETQSFRPRNPYAVSKATQDLLGLPRSAWLRPFAITLSKRSPPSRAACRSSWSPGISSGITKPVCPRIAPASKESDSRWTVTPHSDSPVR
jgi:nucleoside-diphosphate-sugar epimerase